MRMKARAAVTLLAALAALAALACNDDKGSKQAGSATPPAQPDPAVLARQAADQVEALKSFHFLLEHENGGTPIVLNLLMTRAEGDIVKPERLRADVDATATTLGNARVKVQVVNVGDKAVISNPFNPRAWVPLPGQNRLADIFDPGAGTTAALRAATNLRLAGEETIGGTKVWRVEGDVDAGALSAVATSVAEPGYTVKGTAWIGQEKPLVYRVRLEGPLGSKDPQNIVRKIDLSKFDDNVSIELPAGSS
jgi:LppX_LprAFG lipoprotein